MITKQRCCLISSACELEDELMDAGLAQSGVLNGVLNVEPFGSFPILPRRCDYNGPISIGDDEAAQS